MIILDAHLSPALGRWITATCGEPVVALRDLDLHHAEDRVVFEAARRQQAIVMTKDADFVQLLERWGPPPQVIWLTCGNTSNANLKRILAPTLTQTLELLRGGEALVEIG